MPGGVIPPVSVLEEWAKIGNPLHPTQTRGWGLAVLCIVLYVLATVVVLARLWSRFKVRRTAGLDDAIICFAMVPTAGLAISTALAGRIYGFNRHAYDLTPELAVQSRKITIVMELTYILSTGLTKISILLFYRRMADGAISKIYRWIGWAAIASVVLYMLGCMLALFLSCRPLNAFWNKVNIQWYLAHTEGVDYTCFNEGADLLAAAAVSILQDFLACGLPLPLFWKLQLPKRQKIALGAIFSVGFFLCICGCVRIYYIHQIFYVTYDVTWAAYNAWIWTVVEAHLAIICASAPALKVFIKEYLNMSYVGASISRTWREQSYARKGYTGQGDTTPGTNSSANFDSMRREVEMGAIGVTETIDVDSHSLKAFDAGRPLDSSPVEGGRFTSSTGSKSKMKYAESWFNNSHEPI